MGVVMWQATTLEQPFADLRAQDILGGLMRGALPLPLPAWCEPEWLGLVEAALTPAADCRPSFTDLANQLHALMAQLDEGGPA